MIPPLGTITLIWAVIRCRFRASGCGYPDFDVQANILKIGRRFDSRFQPLATRCLHVRCEMMNMHQRVSSSVLPGKKRHVMSIAEMKRIREVSPQLSAAEREAKLSPYRSIIDKYVLRFSDKPLRYPGALGSYGTERHWAKLFIEVYVLNHGRLPDQKLWIDALVDRGGYRGQNTISATSNR
jgi:hypothetical protein